MTTEILTYDDLRGSTGRRAYYRPQRYEALDIFASPVPHVALADAMWRMSDISLNGIAITSRGSSESAVSVGESLPISIQQSGVSLFEGRGTVKRIEPSASGSKVALSFDESFVDIPTLRKKDAQARMRAQFTMLQPTRGDAVSMEYRVLCSDILGAFRSYRAFLERRGDAGMVDNSGAFELCLDQMMPQWREFWLRGNEAVEAVLDDEERLGALKQLTELVLTPEFSEGPIWQRLHAKPFGYPGDFHVANAVHDWKREGETPYAQLLHRLGLDMAECIGTRVDVLRETVLNAVAMKPAGDTMRVVSVGSGAAREVGQILDKTARGSVKFDFTLLDQDERALQHAYEQSFPSAKAHGAGASVGCLNLSLADVVRGNPGNIGAAKQDVVYSLGLFDHLSDARASSVAKSLFDLVKPGGMLVLGNVNKCALSTLWPLECLADWHLHYRTNEDMLGWATGLPKQAAWTELETTGRVRMLFVRKVGGDPTLVGR